MRCFFCDNEATSKIYTNIDGCKQEIDVCPMHMEEIKKFNFEEICENILSIFKNVSPGPQVTMFGKHPQHAPHFGWENMAKCKECFDIFQTSIVPLLQDIHNKHHVKRNTAPLYRLRRDLEVALKEERYEDAARIREEIKKLGDANGKRQ